MKTTQSNDCRESEAARLAVLDFLRDLDSHSGDGLDWLADWCDGLGVNVGDDLSAESENDGNEDDGEHDADADSGDSDADSGEETPEEGAQESDSAEQEDSADKDDSENQEDEDMNQDDSDATPEAYRMALADSLKGVRGFMMGSEPDPAEWGAAVAAMMEGVAMFARGEVSVALLKTLLKGVGYDRAVAVARADGEIVGRNASIEERLMKKNLSDGLPAVSGSSGGRPSSSRPASIFDLAAQARY